MDEASTGIDRVKRDVIHMATAYLWSQRSVCSRLKVGAVITTPDLRRVLAIGYNGPAAGLSEDRCSGTPGGCGCLHAEDNAIARVDSTIPEKQLFVTYQPCVMCAQRIVNAGITRVRYMLTYRDDAGAKLLTETQIDVDQIAPSQINALLMYQASRIRKER